MRTGAPIGTAPIGADTVTVSPVAGASRSVGVIAGVAVDAEPNCTMPGRTNVSGYCVRSSSDYYERDVKGSRNLTLGVPNKGVLH